MTILNKLKSHPAWDAWIEMVFADSAGITISSHPAWDAWIEILVLDHIIDGNNVASRMGCVD